MKNGTKSVLAVCAFFCAQGIANSQVLYGTLTGNVTDPAGAAVPAVHGLPEQTYVIVQSHKDPSGIFIGHSDGVARDQSHQ